MATSEHILIPLVNLPWFGIGWNSMEFLELEFEFKIIRSRWVIESLKHNHWFNLVIDLVFLTISKSVLSTFDRL